MAEAQVGWMDVRTDVAGRFALESDAACLWLRASKSGFASSEDVELQAPSGGLVEGVVLRLRAACRVDGHVLDASGRPVAWGVLLVREEEEEASCGTDEEGRFAFDELAGGRVELSAFDEEGRLGPSVAVELVPGTPARVELRAPH